MALCRGQPQGDLQAAIGGAALGALVPGDVGLVITELADRPGRVDDAVLRPAAESDNAPTGAKDLPEEGAAGRGVAVLWGEPDRLDTEGVRMPGTAQHLQMSPVVAGESGGDDCYVDVTVISWTAVGI